MTYTPVLSTTIAAVGYDPDTATLAVQFHSGAEYHYADVPQDVADGFLVAPSITAYLTEQIKKGEYSYTRVA